MRDQSRTMCMLEHVRRHLGRTAELARKRPVCASAIAQDTAENLGAGSGPGDLVDLGLAVHGEEAHTQREGGRDVALLLDGVAEGNALGTGTGGKRHLDLGDGGAVEGRSEPREKLEDLRGRIAFTA